MRTAFVDITKIRNRKIAQSREYSSDARYYLNLANSSLVKEDTTIKRSNTEKFFHECTDKTNANRYYKNCISILEQVEEEKPLFASLSHLFSDEVIPAVTDLDMLKESVERSYLPDSTKERFYNVIKENKVCDRVISNSKNISKRFNLEKIIRDKKNFSLMESVIECCKLIDTYEMPQYGKLNLTLEQLSYYLQKEAIDYNKKDLIKYVSEYYLLTDRNCKDISKYDNVIHENMFFEDADTEDYARSSNPVQNAIHTFSICNRKSYEDLIALMDMITNLSISIIISNIKDVFDFFRTIVLLDIYTNAEIKNALNYFFDSLFDMEMSRNEIEEIYKNINLEVELVKKMISRSENERQIYSLVLYSSTLKDSLVSIGYSLGTIYPDKDLEQNQTWKQFTESTVPMTLQEFKIFKFQNLIAAALRLDRFFAKKGNRFLDMIKKKTKTLFINTKKFFSESGEIDFSNITSDQRFDTCIAVYEAVDDSDMPELNSMFSQLCSNLNQSFGLPEGSRVSYVNIANRFEVHYEDCTYINLSDSEVELNERTFSDYDLYNINSIAEIATFSESIKFANFETVKESIKKIDDADTLYSVLEMLQYTGLTNINGIELLVSEYSNRHYDDYAGNSKLNSILYEWKDQGYTYGIEGAAILEMQQILTEKVDLNSLKLAIEGLKGKVKDLGAKEKELSRNLDMSMNNFMNSMKRAMTNDRREAIIKGSVIPSFSRCIKVGIALAGVAAFVNPVLAVITAFAGLAISKNLNHKERMLMIDEIDIELKAVEKEIQMAEDSKNMKRYRQLLTYQKKLQREKQRIKYNIKISGATDVPDSSMGTAYNKD